MSSKYVESNIPEYEASNTGNVNYNQTNQQPQYQQAPQYRSTPSATEALTNLSNKLGFGATTGNVSTGQLKEFMVLFEQIKTMTVGKPNALNVKLLALEDNSIYIGSIIMYYKLDKTIYYTIFLFECTAKHIPNQVISIPNNRMIEIDMTTDKFFNQYMKEMAETALLYTEGQDNNLFSVSAIVIPKKHPLTDISNISPIYDFGVANITNVIKLNSGQVTDLLTAKDLKHSSLALVNSIQITPGSTYTSYLSQPIDGDFNMVLSVQNANKQDIRSAIHGADEDICLTSVIGRVDFFRQMVNPATTNYGMQQQSVPGYVPVIIMTQVSRLGKSSQVNDTLLSQLLGIASLMPMINTDDNNWVSVFEPQIGEFSARTSIGVLGLEHNPYPGLQHQPGIVEIIPNGDQIRDANKFTAKEFAQIFCSKNIIVALDILKGGPLEKIQNIIATATKGSKSEMLIINELDAFSDGKFSKLWRIKDQPILSLNPTIIHAGFYTDGDNKQRDIRSVDYLAALEWSNGNQQILGPFVSGFLPDTVTDIHLDQKRKMLVQAIPNMTITGLYQRVFLNNEFISTLDEMLAAMELSYQIKGISNLDDVNSRKHFINSNYFTPIQSHGTFYNNMGNQPIGNRNNFKYGTGISNELY